MSVANLTVEERTRFREIASRFNAFAAENKLKPDEAIAAQAALTAALASDKALEVFPGALELLPMPAASKAILRRLIKEAREKNNSASPTGNRNADVAIFVALGVLTGAGLAYFLR